MRRYVLGFLFANDLSNVLLIRKLRPNWQAGKLNGVGGKIESTDKTTEEAMTREFEEETGLIVLPERWQHFAVMRGPDFALHAYRAFSHNLEGAQSMTDEKVEIVPIDPNGHPCHDFNYVPNVHWLLPLALDRQYPPVAVGVEYE